MLLHARKLVYLAACFLFFQAASIGATANDIEDQLRSEYLHKNLILRCLCAGDELVYDPTGQVIQGNQKQESWTVSDVEITNLELRGDKLLIRGKRMGLLYNPTSKKFERIYRLKAPPLRRENVEEMRITLEGNNKSSFDEWAKTLAGVFISEEHIPEIAPEYWRTFLKSRALQLAANTHEDENSVPTVASESDTNRVLRVGKGVTPPRPISSPDASYANPARANRIQGRVVLRIVVDAIGIPQEIRLVTPLGFGLDEKAIEAVERWRFKPAEKEGKPVAVQVNIEINFRLYY